jgi:hypothetical protein
MQHELSISYHRLGHYEAIAIGLSRNRCMTAGTTGIEKCSQCYILCKRLIRGPLKTKPREQRGFARRVG